MGASATTKPKHARGRGNPLRDPAGVASRDDVRAGTFLPIPGLLREFGSDPVRVYAQAGLDPALLNGAENRFSYATAGRLLECCVAATGCPHFGILVGERFEFAKLGALGAMIRHAPTLGVAIRVLVRHIHLNDRGGLAFLVDTEPGRVALGYSVYHQGVSGLAHVYDMVLAIGNTMLRELCGSAWRADQVTFARSRPRELGPYRRVFRAPLRFDAPHSEIVFPIRWLDHRIEGADADRAEHARRAVQVAEGREGGALEDRVRRAVYALTMNGTASSARVAGLLEVHERQLRRRLRAAGTGIRQVVGDARSGVAQQLLRDTQMSLHEIAAAVHYADATAFSRAFKRWTGTTPSRWRAAAKRR